MILNFLRVRSLSQHSKYEKCPAFYFPPEIGVKIGVKMKISKNMPRNVPILSTIHINRGIINCFLGVTLISNYSALFCIIIITENADKHMEFLDFYYYCDLLDIILEYSK